MPQNPPSPSIKVSPSATDSMKMKSPTPSEASKPKTRKSKAGRMLGDDLKLMPPPGGFPPLGSQKVHLAPGYSQKDWMNLQIASTASIPVLHQPSTRIITNDELGLHNKKEDCWIALRGHVFDITEYTRFHPGGVSQIMKGAGMDATAMFNAIHRYVNFETILKGKQVGIYGKMDKSITDVLSLKGHRGGELESSNVDVSTPKTCFSCAMDSNSQLVPYTQFKEDEKYVFLTVNSRGLRRSRDNWTVGILNKEILLLKLVTKPPDIWIAHFKLTDSLENDSVSVSFTNRFKNMTLKLQKAKTWEWKGLGEPLPDNNGIEDSRSSLEDMHQGTVMMNKEIATNLYFIGIRLPPSVVIGIPVGFDVKVRIGNVARRYTPVHPNFQEDWAQPDGNAEFVYLVYRMYPDGQLTSKMKTLPPGDSTSLKIGCSAGNFDTTWLQGADAFFFCCAGSGITPYYRIIEFIVEHNIALGIKHVVLMYWNRQSTEIVWRASLEKLEALHSWFHFVPVLTQPDPAWTGTKGRICADILQCTLDSIPHLTKNKSRIRFLTCGSDGFNTSVFETVEKLGFHSNNLFTFLG